MGLVRLLLLIAVAVLVYRMFRIWLDKRKAAPGKDVRGGHMVPCKHCGLFIPEAESIRDGDRYYCSEAHRQLENQDKANK